MLIWRLLIGSTGRELGSRAVVGCHRSSSRASPGPGGIGYHDGDIREDYSSDDEDPTYHRPMEHRECDDGQDEAHGADAHRHQVAAHPRVLVVPHRGGQACDGVHLVAWTGSAFPHNMTICRGHATYPLVVG
jgi:hypothetical protein